MKEFKWSFLLLIVTLAFSVGSIFFTTDSITASLPYLVGGSIVVLSVFALGVRELRRNNLNAYYLGLATRCGLAVSMMLLTDTSHASVGLERQMSHDKDLLMAEIDRILRGGIGDGITALTKDWRSRIGVVVSDGSIDLYLAL